MPDGATAIRAERLTKLYGKARGVLDLAFAVNAARRLRGHAFERRDLASPCTGTEDHAMTTTSLSPPRELRRPHRHHVLVVVDEPCPSPSLCTSVREQAAREPIEALIIAPAHGSAATQWYIDDDAARADATQRLRVCVNCLAGAGIHAEGRLADPDPVSAIADALHDFPAEEILIVTAPQRPSTWLHKSVIDRARRSFPQPVRHLVVPPTTAGSASA